MSTRHTDFEDDGRTLADMSELRGGPLPHRRTEGREGPSPASREVSDELQSPEERMAVVLGTLKAALSVGMVYLVAFGIVILLMVLAWS